MVNILTFPARLPALILKGLYRISRIQKDIHGRLYAFYAFPAVVALMATFIVLRTVIYFWPGIGIEIGGIHVHHFTWGILILGVAGFWALCTESARMRYILALSWGSGAGFVLDEFYPWLHLDDAAYLFSRYNAVIYGAAVLLVALLVPAVVDQVRRAGKR